MSNKRFEFSKKLRRIIGFDQVEYFPEDARRLLTDWFILDEFLTSSQEELVFFDYSFALAPLYKGIETVLSKIALDLGLVNNEQMIGGYFNDQNIDKVFPEIAEIVQDKKAQSIVKSELSEIRTFLVRYRHIPAHTGFRFDSLDQEQMAAHSAIHNIGCLTKDLMSYKLISLPQKPMTTPDTEEIPF